MTTYLHTIPLVNERPILPRVSSRRQSKWRHEACLVVTTTQRTLDIEASTRARIEAQLADAQAEFSRLQGLLGLTPDAAQVTDQARVDAWYGPGGYERVLRQIREELQAPNSLWTAEDEQAARELAKEELTRRGLADPLDPNGPHWLLVAASACEAYKWQLAKRPVLVIGSQAVVSWHQTKASAHKNPDLNFWRKRGYDVEVRTDLVVIEKE